MKNVIKKVLDWFKESNRWKHLLGGFLVGLLPLNMYAGLYGSVAVGLSLEYKDYAHGGKFDWVDVAMTVGGGLVGSLLTLLF